MNKSNSITIDGNTAASSMAYLFSEVAIIYPITPASPMGELADSYSANNKQNLFGDVVEVVEMQSEAGAAGAIHGALSAGALATTFTASQGLLLMLPNMHKIAGEMLPAVFHIAARSLAAQSLSIFADHSDVMSARNTGFAFLSSCNVQEVQDLAVIAHLCSVETKIPFLHFFDGFRTSHCIKKIQAINNEVLSSMINHKAIKDFKDTALRPEKPFAKVGAENPDVYFQGRETVNSYYDKCPEIVKQKMKLFAEKTGRQYNLFDYVGDENAEKIIIAMGSANDTIHETVNYLNKKGEKVGAVKIRLYRPFSVKDFINIIPKSVKKIAVLDRTKEPGSVGEPLYLDIVAALKDKHIKIIGGRYGLSSKEFTPSMVKAVFNHLNGSCEHNFTVGINDDVTNLSLDVKEKIVTENPNTIRCKFWAYGSDGTVSANKNSIKIIGENTDKHVQAYFSYDSHKSGGVTISHLRFSDNEIRSEYFITEADFVALHKQSYIGRYDILEGIKKQGIFLLNCSWNKEEAFSHLTKKMQDIIIDKKVNFYVIDANKISQEVGLKNKISTIMQAAFFKLTNIIPEEKSIELMKKAVEKQFSKKGKEIVEKNFNAIDNALKFLQEISVKETNEFAKEQILIPDKMTGFAKDIIAPIMRLKGDEIPVSKMPLDGAIPTGTSKLEKRGIATHVPKWIPEKCTQCGMCSIVCPHATIRIKQIKKEDLKNAPSSFKTIQSNADKELQFRVQVYAEDCAGAEVCSNCINRCPMGALTTQTIEEARRSGEVENQKFFDSLPDITDGVKEGTLKWSQLKTNYFEFPGACAGCGETPYIKLLTQLFGENMIIANATGCSSIWGGTFPLIPYTKDKNGRGPAWANSLFEDNAEYGFGFRLAIDSNRKHLKSLIEKLLQTGTTHELADELKQLLEKWGSSYEEQKEIVFRINKELPNALEKVYGESKLVLEEINNLKDYLTDKSVWIVGGDGWAYDIGYGGLDHVLASGKNVNVLVLDTEVYSNTGGQCSKATPLGATAKFAVSGKKVPKKDLGKMMTSYGYIYVASVSLGANMQHVINAMREAESYNGPSIIIAYCPCIEHGIDMSLSSKEEKLAVDSGYWPLYRFDPRLKEKGKNALQLDMPAPKVPFKDYINNEIRYKSLQIQFPAIADKLFKLAEKAAKEKYDSYVKMSD